MVVAYLRVSTEKQFLANQREELLRFAEKNGLKIDKWYTETVSGSVSSKERKLSGMLNRMQRGDALIVTEISRLSRTLLEIMPSTGLMGNHDHSQFVYKERNYFVQHERGICFSK